MFPVPVGFVIVIFGSLAAMAIAFLQQVRVAEIVMRVSFAFGVISFLSGLMIPISPEWLNAHIGYMGGAIATTIWICGVIGQRLSRPLTILGIVCSFGGGGFFVLVWWIIVGRYLS